MDRWNIHYCSPFYYQQGHIHILPTSLTYRLPHTSLLARSLALSYVAFNLASHWHGVPSTTRRTCVYARTLYYWSSLITYHLIVSSEVIPVLQVALHRIGLTDSILANGDITSPPPWYENSSIMSRSCWRRLISCSGSQTTTSARSRSCADTIYRCV